MHCGAGFQEVVPCELRQDPKYLENYEVSASGRAWQETRSSLTRFSYYDATMTIKLFAISELAVRACLDGQDLCFDESQGRAQASGHSSQGVPGERLYMAILTWNSTGGCPCACQILGRVDAERGAACTAARARLAMTMRRNLPPVPRASTVRKVDFSMCRGLGAFKQKRTQNILHSIVIPVEGKERFEVRQTGAYFCPLRE
ncbi:BQ5605_C019g08886 [Microbotryum silenes-dioicae]|uniref:BQ5605_C019g08886 protein n=1 Tax=Microbotryum silenes-dioicae TaxID=796604 RepID=A0A2X0M000_9BASI|nr:BQ5605_C019g08886 [Microbotryum silenes-dioicae]